MALKFDDLVDFIFNYWYLWVLANIIGVLFGYHYYWKELISTSWFYWPWIAVSPNACFFMALTIFSYFRNHSSVFVDFFGLLAFIGNFKYGLWTVIVVLSDFEGFAASVSAEYYFLIVIGHFLMFLQSFLVFYFVSFDWDFLVYGFLWFLSNDLLDYSGPMLHSWIPETASIRIAMFTAYGLTFVSIVVWLYFYRFR